MDQITTLKLSALRESPFNPRKAFSEADLEELSLSIASQGVLQPIVVRPAPNRPHEANNLFVTHELVFGHRRFRAAQLAGLLEIPAIVRDLDDAETAIAQVHENTQRKDVSAIEEADSFIQLHLAHKMSADAIAAAIGKSRSYVYGRLKIAKVAPEVRDAVTEQGLPAEIALEVARIPNHKLQKKALDDLRGTSWVDGKNVPDGWLSYREARRKLRNLFDLSLDDAPFDIADATLAVRAGACTTCPRRAGNDPDLQGVLEDDVCMDSECYEVKCSAHLLRQIAVLRAAGHTVIEGEAAKALLPHRWSYTPEGHQLLTHKPLGGVEHDPSLKDGLVAMGGQAPKTTFVLNRFTGQLIECVTQKQAEDIIEAAWPEVASEDESASTPASAARAHSTAYRDPRTPEERALSYPNWNRVAAEIMKRAAARTERTLDELRWAACALVGDCDVDIGVIDAMGWREEMTTLENSDAEDKPDCEADFAIGKLKLATADQLATFIVLFAISMAPYGGRVMPDDSHAQKLAIAAHYGVDVVAAAGLQEQTNDAGDAGESDAQAQLLEPVAA